MFCQLAEDLQINNTFRFIFVSLRKKHTNWFRENAWSFVVVVVLYHKFELENTDIIGLQMCSFLLIWYWNNLPFSLHNIFLHPCNWNYTVSVMFREYQWLDSPPVFLLILSKTEVIMCHLWGICNTAHYAPWGSFLSHMYVRPGKILSSHGYISILGTWWWASCAFVP